MRADEAGKIRDRGVGVVTIVLVALALGCIAWGIVAAFTRPPNYPEGCILYNAARLRQGLALYVDATRGAHEHGEPPARYFVAYTPIAALALSVLPAARALAVARLVGLAAWVVALGRPVWTARPGCRSAATVAAALTASTFGFVLWAASAKPDGVALLLASVACTRALDRGRANAVDGLFFGAAFLVKQSVFGLALGALGGTFLVAPRRRSAGAIAATATVALGLGLLQIASGGVAIAQMRDSLGLAFGVTLFAENAVARGPFLLGPLAAAAVAALVARRRATAADLALASLAGAVGVACIGYGKVGAAANYGMEPCLASVIVLSRFPLVAPRTIAGRVALTASIALTLAWSSVATMRSLADEPFLYEARRAALARIRGRCLDRPGAFVMSTDPGLEMELDGRIHTHDVELWNQTRLGRFPSALWVADVRQPNVRCFVSFVGTDTPPAAPDALVPPDVARALREEFTLDAADAGYALYLRR